MALALEILTLAIGATALALLLPRAPRRSPTRQREPAPPMPADLERVERALLVQSAADVHVRLRPLLREVAQPLAWRHGVRLDHDPDGARELLGADLWELVRLDRPRPEDPRASELTREQLAAFVERLEAL